MNPETIELGVGTTVIGMGVVFSVLIILTITTWLLTKIIDGSIERKKSHETAATATAAPVPVQKASELVATSGISAKTVAAIMAAVCLASGQPLSRLRFTAIHRGNTAEYAWSASSTADIIANRQAYL
jgi:sodium pump decarboxylase gamma subunit